MKKLLIFILIIVLGLSAFFIFQKTREVEIPPEKEPLLDPASLNWEEATPNAPWSKRDAHSSVVFKGKMWLLGGVEGKEDFNNRYWELPHKNDVWVSEDGRDWQLAATNTPWGLRRSLVAVVFKEKIWLMGGWEQKSGSTKNDVWYSEDGINWIKATSSIPWTPREGHTVAVFEDKIWLMGGVNFDRREVMNDVWYTEDGIDWFEATSSAAWSLRYDHATAVFQGRIWLTGGVAFKEQAKNDIWSSDDGKNWELVTDNAPWPVRHGHTSVVFEDRIWIISGWDTINGKGLRDVWYSEDGYDWKKTQEVTPWIGREDHTSVVFKDRIWLLGGMDTNWNWRNDIWYSSFSARDLNSLLVLVNKNQPLPASYIPPDLVNISDYGIPSARSGFLLQETVINDLREMINEAAKEGISLKIISAYRSYDYQEKTYNRWVEELGKEEADRQSAQPGYSEHQLGTVIDFNELNFSFADTAAGIWLKENAWKYGWVLSFPADSEQITGYAYEPWHYRYIGKANASELQESEMILFDFLKAKNK